MTRIIGGEAGGRRLKVPAGERTRPTTDRVREALFSALESALGSLTGLRFLDLYAGSGAVGLEARSRGAAAVTLVESDRRTARTVLTENVRTLGLDGVEVLAVQVAPTLSRPPVAAYDVVFADPPYDLAEQDLGQVLALLTEQGWLAAGAVVVVERSSRSPAPTWPAGGLEPDRSRTYGETVLHWAHHRARGPAG